MIFKTCKNVKLLLYLNITTRIRTDDGD